MRNTFSPSPHLTLPHLSLSHFNSMEKEKLESKILESMSHPFIVHLYKTFRTDEVHTHAPSLPPSFLSQFLPPSLSQFLAV